MKKYFIFSYLLVSILVLSFLSSCDTSTTSNNEVAIIPLPNQVKVNNNEFVLPHHCVIGISDAMLQPAADFLKNILCTATGYDIQIKLGKGDINLNLSEIGKPGSYRLCATSKDVTITGNTYNGVIYGIESLRQLLPPQIEEKSIVKGINWVIPGVEITDSPRYEWRGLMLDVSRHFYDKKEVMELLDLMALYKMNKFHWHLTDDQGWRVEIKKYPLLTEKGAWRTFNGNDRGCMKRAISENNADLLIPTDKMRIVNGDTLYGGFYTQEDIKEIIDYAGVRGIDVVPEIDMPGHMTAAIKNYDNLSCVKKVTKGRRFSSPLCPGKESTLEFCKNVYSEIISLFPYKYIHIGGDEVAKENWEICPDCQNRIRTEGLKSEEELQAWFIHKMEDFFNAHGKHMIGWDEIIEGGLSKTATVMWWRGWNKNAPVRATEGGNKVIFTPTSHFYFDYGQSEKTPEDIYNFDPTMKLTDINLQKNILGVQCNVWCERIPTKQRIQYQIAPRMLSVAELGWSNPEQRNLDAYKKRFTKHLTRLNVMNINYFIPELKGALRKNVFIDSQEVNISCADSSVSIHYTTDGSIPTLESTIYNGPITIHETTDFTFRTFRQNGKPMRIFKALFEKSDYAPAINVKKLQNGLNATLYDFKDKDCELISKAPVLGTWRMDSISVPQNVKENLGMVVKGYLKVPADDVYTVSLTSVDGSMLNIQDVLFLDNNGTHRAKTKVGQVALSAGVHPFALRYFCRKSGKLQINVKNSQNKIIKLEFLSSF